MPSGDDDVHKLDISITLSWTSLWVPFKWNQHKVGETPSLKRNLKVRSE